MSHEPLRATCCGCLQVVVDPPRSGLHPQVIRLLRQVCGQLVLCDVAASPAVLATLTLSCPVPTPVHTCMQLPDVRRVVYVSCNPATQAQDVAKLCEPAGSCSGSTPVADHAFTLSEVVPVDMLPHTVHVESVAVLERCEGSS